MARASAVKMPPEANAAHGCEGARRVLALMLTFSADDHTLTARQLAERTGIALPSVYRYLTLLRETGLLAGDERGSYRLSARLVGLARAAEAAESIIDVADPVMRDLAARTGETVILVRLIGRSAVCVHRVQSPQQLRISFEAGQPLPLDRGASARLLLASFFRIAGVSKRLASSCSSGAMSCMGMNRSTCIENAIFYAYRLSRV